MALVPILRRLLPITALAVGALLNAPAAAARCLPPQTPPVVTMTVEEGGLRLDHTLDAKGIGDLRARLATGPQGTPPPNWRTVGLTVADFRVRSSLSGQYQDGCAQVTAIDLTIGYGEQVVYVPRTYERGSCTFDAVLEHENEHVVDNLDVLREFAPRFEAQARAVAAKAAALPVASVEEARSRPMQMLEAAFAPVSEAFQAAQAARAMALDTPDNYRAVMARCKGW